jgi:hypothetical protein
MNTYTIAVVIGNVYEITVEADSKEEAETIAMKDADYYGEIVEAGRAIYSTESHPQNKGEKDEQ